MEYYTIISAMSSKKLDKLKEYLYNIRLGMVGRTEQARISQAAREYNTTRET